jgi:acetylornithine/succinyldiaminopimelate/putrescine aminotransferase
MTNKKYLNRWNASLQGNYGMPAITLVKGKGIVVTDGDGNFKIDLNAGQTILISFVGFKTIERKIEKRVKYLSL